MADLIVTDPHRLMINSAALAVRHVTSNLIVQDDCDLQVTHSPGTSVLHLGQRLLLHTWSVQI